MRCMGLSFFALFFRPYVGQAAAKTCAIHAVAVDEICARSEQHVIGMGERIGIGLLHRDDRDDARGSGFGQQLPGART